MTIYQDTILSDLFSWPTQSLKHTDRLNSFIQKARKIHGDRYGYDQVHYVDSSTKVTIICPKHGPFPKTPANHLKKQGCQLCTRESIKFSTDQFISKSREIHGSKYGYDDVDYQAIMTKVKIKCPMHGLFFQNPRDHLKGAGCPECQRLTRSMTTKEYKQQCDIVHQNRYNYSQTVFKNAHTKVKITCPEHGIFEMPSYSHLRGVGCQ
jgi:hypothetical protein